MGQYVQWIQVEKLKLIKETLSTSDQNIENVDEGRWKVCLPFRIQAYICPNTDIAYRNYWNSFDSSMFIEVSILGNAQLRNIHSRGAILVIIKIDLVRILDFCIIKSSCLSRKSARVAATFNRQGRQ